VSVQDGRADGTPHRPLNPLLTVRTPPSGVTVPGAIIATISCASMMVGSIERRPSIPQCLSLSRVATEDDPEARRRYPHGGRLRHRPCSASWATVSRRP
jgi:hypothetical protein